MTRRYSTQMALVISLASAVTQAAPKVALPHLPLFFEPNRGQAPPEVRFVARGNGASLLLEDRAAVLCLPSGELRMGFSGNSRLPQAIEALDPQPGLSSYFVGNDPAAWRSGIPQSARVRYKQVYPGIDLVFKAGGNNRFEYDFVVAPNADPSRIDLQFEGAQSIQSDGDGGIILRTSSGEIRQPRPRIYQDLDSGRKEIPGSMILGKGDSIRFKLGEYDHTRTLTIDPLIIQYLVGNVDDEFSSIARDGAGNVYVAGYTSSTTFTTKPIGASPAGFSHILVIKLSPDLSQAAYVTVIGGTAGDFAGGIAVDGAGNAYLTGNTQSANFPTTPGAAQTNYGNKNLQNGNQAQSAFILKLDPKGATLLYSTFLAGDGVDRGTVITVDSNGVVYVAGDTSSDDFPTTSGSVRLGLVFVDNIIDQATWVAKLSADGKTFNYVAVVGGKDTISTAAGIAIDSNGNAYVGGLAVGLDFPTAGHPIHASAPQTCGPLCYGSYVFELNNSGKALVFSTYWGGSLATKIYGLALDSQNNIYIAGWTTSTDLPVTSNTILPAPTSIPNGVAYVAALNNSGSTVLACSYLGPDKTLATNVIVRAPGVIGITGSSPTTFATVQPQPGLNGLGGVYVELDPLFQHLLSSFSPEPFAGQYTAAAVGPDGSVALGASTPLLPSTSGTLVQAGRNGIVVLVTPAPANTNPQAPVIKSGGVVSASSFGAFSSISPGTWIEIYGSNLAADSRSWASSDFSGLNAPMSLDGTKVTIGGQSAFIDYISPTQVNALVSSSTPLGAQQLTVTTAQGVSSSYSITVNASQPGLLAPPSFNIGGVQYAVAIFASDGAYALPTGAIAGVNSRPAKPGDVLVLYGVGFGTVTPGSPAGQIVQQANSLSVPFQMSIGGVQATVTYDGLAPNYTGLYQFNLTVPSVAAGGMPLTFKLNGTAGTQILSIATGN